MSLDQILRYSTIKHANHTETRLHSRYVNYAGNEQTIYNYLINLHISLCLIRMNGCVSEEGVYTAAKHIKGAEV